MPTTINKPIPIRRPTTQKLTLHTSLRPHRCQHPLPRPRHLTLRLRTQQHHQRLVHGAAEFHRATRFRQPHRDAQRIETPTRATQTRLDVLAWINFPQGPRDASTPRAIRPRLQCHD
jgi:hypothetical protein